jgi:hypothetical protein
MRELTGRERLDEFMRALGAAARAEARVYFTGGATAVLHGWRDTTVDIDIECVPDRDELLRAIPDLKERLRVNVELAAPSHFIPVLPGWEERSPFIRREGLVSFHHYDYYAQALSKIERGHSQDLVDVSSMLGAGLVEPARLRHLFERIVPELYRYPAIDATAFGRALDRALGGHAGT